MIVGRIIEYSKAVSNIGLTNLTPFTFHLAPVSYRFNSSFSAQNYLVFSSISIILGRIIEQGKADCHI